MTVRVRYVVEFPNDDRPTELLSDTRSVLAEFCAEYDVGQGGVTFEEINPKHLQALAEFSVGSEVFVESPKASDCLDDTDDDTAARTAIWWRALVVEVEPSGVSRRRRARAHAPEPLDRQRALARFRKLVGRSVTFGFVPYGPLVEAETPKELAEAVERALVAECRQRPS